MQPIHSIQVLRALAAFMVAIHHVQPDAAVVAARAGFSFTRSDVLPWMAGVDIFFVVSGFIMVHASRELFGRPGAPRLFLARRLARIVPLYWAATTLFLLVTIATPGALNSGLPNAGQIAASYLFWPVENTAGLIQPIYSLGWTLNYEMLFYVLFGTALVLPARWVGPAVALVLMVLVATQALAGPLALPLGFWAQPIVLEFAIGMAIGLLRGRGLRLGGWLRWLMVLSAIALLVAATSVAWAETGWGALVFRGGAAALLVLAAACGRSLAAPSALVRGLSHLGDASYALYLVHPFAMRALREVFLRLAPGQTGTFILLALLCAIVGALIVHRWFERPMTRLLRRGLRA